MYALGIAIDYKRGSVDLLTGARWIFHLAGLRSFNEATERVTALWYDFQFRRIVLGVSPQRGPRDGSPRVQYLGPRMLGPVEIVGASAERAVLIDPSAPQDRPRARVLKYDAASGRLTIERTVVLRSFMRPESCLVDDQCRILVVLDDNASVGTSDHVLGVVDLRTGATHYASLFDFLDFATLEGLYKLDGRRPGRTIILWRYADNRNIALAIRDVGNGFYEKAPDLGPVIAELKNPKARARSVLQHSVPVIRITIRFAGGIPSISGKRIDSE